MNVLVVLVLTLGSLALAQNTLPKVTFTDTTLENGLRVIIVLDSEGTQLDAVAVSDIRWFRLKKQGYL